MPDLRERLHDANPYPSMCIPDDPIREERHIGYAEGVDAALEAVKEALLSDEAVDVAERVRWEWGAGDDEHHRNASRAALAAALATLDAEDTA